MDKLNKPAVGDTLYFAAEHLYYVPGRAAPLKEYCIYPATVTGFLAKQNEMRLITETPSKQRSVRYFRVCDIGRTIFSTAKEAAVHAAELTAHHEEIWGAYRCSLAPLMGVSAERVIVWQLLSRNPRWTR